MSFANLHGADLSEADLHGADLSGTDLHRADLGGTDLYRADLSEADLHGTDLSRTDLHRADLSGANLREVEGLTTEELVSQANSLEGATLPDGMLYQKESATDSTEEVPQRAPIGSDEESPESASH